MSHRPCPACQYHLPARWARCPECGEASEPVDAGMRPYERPARQLLGLIAKAVGGCIAVLIAFHLLAILLASLNA